MEVFARHFRSAALLVLLAAAGSGCTSLSTDHENAAARVAISLDEPPETAVGRKVEAWLDAVNSGNPREAEEQGERAVDFQQVSGGADLVRIEESSETALTVLLRQRLTSVYTRAVWALDTPDADGFERIVLYTIPTPSDLPSVERVDDEALRDEVQSYMDRSDFSGVVLFARDGEPAFVLARGLADRERDVPITRESRFRVGSMNKMFTAVAILQLVQGGQIELDAPVGRYLRDYPNEEFASLVTIHHLLCHTGGAGDIFGPEFDANRLALRTHQDYVDLYGARAPDFTPGTEFRYANYGFVVLGRIIEEVSGQSYYDYVHDHILRPAGMTRTGFAFEETPVEGRVVGYALEPSGYQSAMDTFPPRGMAAGGAYSTVDDFVAFASALTEHRLLDAEHTQLLTTRKANGSYAYGFGEYRYGDLRIIGHEGAAPGQDGDFRIVGDGQAVIVALSNVAPPVRGRQTIQFILDRGTFFAPDGEIAQFFPWLRPFPTPADRVADFRASDADGDGRLDKTEYAALLEWLGYSEVLDSQFAERDSDGDGYVSGREYEPTFP